MLNNSKTMNYFSCTPGPDDNLLDPVAKGEREPDEERTKVCPDCDGDMEAMSACCGASIDTDMLICMDCKEHSELAVCETCNGEGRVKFEDA